MLVRLNKYLRDSGLCSRRKADEFIEKGYIKINGAVITDLGSKINPEIDKIEILDGAHQEKSQFRYILLNKPKGYVCSKNDEDGIPVFELVPQIDGLTYAGRLDKESHGLVILSNDGEFVYKVAGAEFGKEKEYLVRVKQELTADFIKNQSNGSLIIDGKQVKPAKVKQIGTHVYKIILTEGINRQIRKMAEAMGYNIIDLKRIRIDNITDKDMNSGEWREISADEINKIMVTT